MLLEINNNRPNNIIVVRKKNKVGLSKIENNTVTVIYKCKYDSIDIINYNFFLHKGDTIFYYNSITDKKAIYSEVVLDIPYMYACDKKYQYIIIMATDEIIYKKKLNKYNKSKYIHIGNTDKGCTFYDSKDSTYLYPTENGYTFYNQPVSRSITINDNNIVNIVENENGIGVIDSFGNIIIDNEYDEISFELNIIANTNNKLTTRNIPCQKIYTRSWLYL